jgi:hypothetical protein
MPHHVLPDSLSIRGGFPHRVSNGNRISPAGIVRTLPDEASVEEIVEEIQILAAIRAGEDAADHRRVVAHDDVKTRVAT